MREDLVHLINEYLTDEIGNHVTNNNLEFNWTYERGQFVLHFTLANTPFTIVASSHSKKKIGMQIEPDETSIKIVCYNYIDNFEIDNFEQVANILGEF